MRPRPVALGLALVLLVAGGPARAATFTVTGQDDVTDAQPGDGVCATTPGDCTLRAAVQEANATTGPDTIVVPAGTFAVTLPTTHEDLAASGDLDVRDELTIVGAGQTATFLDAGGLDRVLDVPVAVPLTVTDLTVRNGNASAGFPLDGAGGVYVREGASLTLRRVALEDNHTAAEGGGVLVGKNGSLTLSDVTFTRNFANASGAIALPEGGSLTADNVTFEQNELNAVWLVDTNAVLSNVRFLRNRNTGLVNTGGRVLVTDAAFVDNDSGIFNVLARITIMRATFSGHRTTNGAGLLNTGDGDGTTVATLTDVSFTSNHATMAGGAIMNLEASVSVTNATFSQNVAEIAGGAVDNSDGDMTFINATFSGNQATGVSGSGFDLGNGGALANSFAGTVHLTNTTFTGNLAFTGPAILNAVTTGSMTLRNTIVAEPGGCVLGGTPGGLVSLGHNIESGVSCLFTASSDRRGVDPLLAPLSAGGSSPLATHAPLPGSPAIDAGDDIDCPSVDARGVPRPQDGDGDGRAVCDIGAHEVALTATTTTTTTSTTTTRPGDECRRLEGFDRAACELGAARAAPPCGQEAVDARVAGFLQKRLEHALRAVGRARNAKRPGKRRRQLDAADSQLTRVLGRTRRAMSQGTLSFGCRQAIDATIGTLRVTVGGLRT